MVRPSPKVAMLGKKTYRTFYLHLPFLVLGITNFGGHTHGSHYQPPTSFIAVAPLLVSYGDSGCHGYFSWTWRPLVLRTLDCLAYRCLWSGLSLRFIFLLAGSEGLVSFCPHQYLKFHPYLSSLPLFLSAPLSSTLFLRSLYWGWNSGPHFTCTGQMLFHGPQSLGLFLLRQSHCIARPPPIHPPASSLGLTRSRGSGRQHLVHLHCGFDLCFPPIDSSVRCLI